MDIYKLRIKIGVHEFEAEGPSKEVKAQFEAWKELIASLPISSPPASEAVGKLPPYVAEVKTREGSMAPWDIFSVDDKRKLITLKVHPTGERRDADAALLALYGYKQIYTRDEVLVTKLKESLEVSGLRPERIDRTLSAHTKAGLVLKTGRSKGSKYRLTNTGFDYADNMARELFGQLAR